MPYGERKRVPDDRSDILKGSLPKGPPAHPLDTENPSIEKENRGEATRRGMEAGESYFVLNPATDRQPVEIKE